MSYLDKASLKVVGSRPIRPDGVDKVTGRANFGADMVMPGMLWGRIKRSPHAHARIVGIDTTRAMALPGVKAVITRADFPDVTPERSHIGAGEPYLHEEKGKLCPVRHQSKITGQREHRASAGRDAIYRGDDRFLESAHVLYEITGHARKALMLLGGHSNQLADDFVHATPRTEAFARTGENYNFDGFLVCCFGEKSLQLGIGFKRQRIEPLGVV